jgi:molybdopterin synthase catalytic subunit
VVERTAHSRLEPEHLDPSHELQQLIGAAGAAGAIVSFVGSTRAEGGEVDALVLEQHPTLTERSLQEIARDALERFAVDCTWVAHRCGRVGAGEAIVFAGAAARHRRAAFDAADYLMDRLKTDAILWKKEDGPAGSRWVDPTASDYAARRRWSD